MANKNAALGEILVQKGWLTRERVEEGLRKQKSTREFLGAILLREKWITEEQLTAALSEQFRIPHVSLRNFYIDWELVMKFSASLISEHQCFPLRKDGLTVVFGITDPLDAWAIARAESETKGHSVTFVLVNRSEMSDLLERYRQHVNIQIRHSLGEAQ